jgi:hypothetical protein
VLLDLGWRTSAKSMEFSDHVGLVEVSVFVSYLESGTGWGEAAGVESHLKAGSAGKQFGGEADFLAKSTFKLADTKTDLTGQDFSIRTELFWRNT